MIRHKVKKAIYKNKLNQGVKINKLDCYCLNLLNVSIYQCIVSFNRLTPFFTLVITNNNDKQ